MGGVGRITSTPCPITPPKVVAFLFCDGDRSEVLRVSVKTGSGRAADGWWK